MLSPEQKQRVLAALHFDPDAGVVVALVDQLETAAELHQFVLNYNPNDGLLPLWSVIGRSTCDQGTALCVYWLLGDFVMDREAYREKSDPAWDGVGLIEEIERRYLGASYTERNIRFAPLDFLDWSPTKLKLMKHQYGGELPFPEIMLEPSPGEVVPKEAL